jgi:hypothetical protein
MLIDCRALKWIAKKKEPAPVGFRLFLSGEKPVRREAALGSVTAPVRSIAG